MFLDTAISVARNPEDLEANTIFAVRHLAEIAKAFDDTVVDSLIEARRAADQATLTAWKAIAAANTKACCRDFRKLGFYAESKAACLISDQTRTCTGIFLGAAIVQGKVHGFRQGFRHRRMDQSGARDKTKRDVAGGGQTDLIQHIVRKTADQVTLPTFL